jgi:hypothetical protein
MTGQKICDEDALWIQETLSSGRRHPNGKRIYRTWLAAAYGISTVTLTSIERGRGAYKHLARNQYGHPSYIKRLPDNPASDTRYQPVSRSGILLGLSRPQSNMEVEIPVFLRRGPQEYCDKVDEAMLDRVSPARRMWTSVYTSCRTVARHVRRITINRR